MPKPTRKNASRIKLRTNILLGGGRFGREKKFLMGVALPTKTNIMMLPLGHDALRECLRFAVMIVLYVISGLVCGTLEMMPRSTLLLNAHVNFSKDVAFIIFLIVVVVFARRATSVIQYYIVDVVIRILRIVPLVSTTHHGDDDNDNEVAMKLFKVFS